MTLDIDHLRKWIGRRESTSEEVTAALVARFAATFDTDVTDRDGQVPRMMHWCLALPVASTSALGRDGHPVRGDFLPPVALPSRMWAGGALTHHGDFRVGETVVRNSTIRDIALKEGRSGPLCFVTVNHELTSNGSVVLTERQDIVYREAEVTKPLDATPTKPNSSQVPPKADHRLTVVPSAPFLFRYSALTFNGHRIHYDTPYARSEEHYPGLVVHGPLQATLLAQFAHKLKGTPPARFSFRSLSPLFNTANFTLNAVEDEAGINLWTSYPDGPVATEARAEW